MDIGLIRPDQLPTWMDMDTLYIFKYDGRGDTSQFTHKINIK